MSAIPTVIGAIRRELRRVVDVLVDDAEIVKVLNDPSVRDALNKHGLTPQPTTRAELTAFMKKEDAKWGAIVRERKITAN